MYRYLFFVLFLVAGCHDHQVSDKQVFRYNQPEGLTTLDPAFAKSQPVMWITHQLYNTLVEIQADLRIHPSLAKTWEISPDGLTYRFFLRDSVFFHDSPVFPDGRGRKLIADDVVYSLGRILDPAVASPGAWIFRGRVDSITPFRSVDSLTVEIKLQKPFPPILGILSMQYCSIVSKEAVQRYGKDFRRNPVGTGPFVMKSWEEGQNLILQRFEGYFETDSTGHRLPYLEELFEAG